MASFKGLKPANPRASSTASASSRKRDSRCEVLLRRELWRRGYRFLVDVGTLPGRPDIVFSRWRVAVFCDGDFWHGRQLRQRLKSLATGHNPEYWVAKIEGNVKRDKRNSRLLVEDGWLVLRYWETEITKNPSAIADRVDSALRRIKQRKAVKASEPGS